MTVTVYTKPECGSCEQTKRVLDRKHISYNVIDVFEDPEARKLVEDTGKLEMPYVRVTDGDELVTEWHGFRYNKILELTKSS